MYDVYCICKIKGDCFLSIIVFFFFFKQKTAYDMRISDWSSDVCSSDLRTLVLRPARPHRRRQMPRVVTWASPRTVKLRCAANEIGRASCRERVCQYV